MGRQAIPQSKILFSSPFFRLEDPRDPGNLELFQFAWLRSQPVLLSGLLERLDKKLWSPDNFVHLPEHAASAAPLGSHHSSGPGSSPPSPDHHSSTAAGGESSVVVATSPVSDGQSLGTFFQGFDDLSSRPLDEKTGEPLVLRLRENWPSQEDQFLELLPNQYRDLMANLPLPQYLDRDGVLNLAARLPDCFVRVDLGPRLWGGYSRTAYPLQYSVSDSMHLSVATAKDYRSTGNDGGILDFLEAAGCPDLERARQQPGRVAAVWQVFHPSHADRLKAFILRNMKSSDQQQKASLRPKDPLQEPTLFLTDRLLGRLKEEEGLVPWTMVQMRGEGVLVAAGAPYQVRLVQASLLVQSDFVSPEHMAQSVRLSFSDLQQFDDRLQVKNIIFHACKDALSVLQKPETGSSSKQ
jgi:lysine-specific demethylase 3